MDNETLQNKLQNAIDEMDDYTLFCLHNEYVRNTNNYDDEIFLMEDFNEMMEGEKPIDIAFKMFNGDFNPNNEYFYFNGYANLKSISGYDLTDYIYTNDIIDYIIDNNDALECDEIDEILEQYNDEMEDLKK